VPSYDVEGLLLEAYRRVDEGERPMREKDNKDQDPCSICSLECTPEIKQRYLKPDVCLWSNMPSVLKDPLFKKARSFEGLSVSDAMLIEGDEYVEEPDVNEIDGGFSFL